MVIFQVVLHTSNSNGEGWWKGNKLSMIQRPLGIELASGKWGEEYPFNVSNCFLKFKSPFYFSPLCSICTICSYLGNAILFEIL